MPTFVRFILLVIVLGAALNLAMVLISNARDHGRQSEKTFVEGENLSKVITEVNGRLRWGEMVVEWQKVDANAEVLETSLLLRQFTPTETNQQAPLPAVRVIIPGSRVGIDGLVLDFGPTFMEEYKLLRNAKLFYFAHVFAESTPLEERFTFVPRYRVPLATQVHNLGTDPHVMYLESKMWQHLWDLIESPDHDMAAKNGLKVTWTKPAFRVVRNGGFYEITVGLEGVTIMESDDRGHRTEMLQEGKTLK